MKVALAFVAALGCGVAIGPGSAKAEAWWPFGGSTASTASTASERYVAHSSYKLILQRSGQYVAGTIRSSLPFVEEAAAKAAPVSARKAAPYLVGAAVGAAAPAWAPLAATGLVAVSLGYTAYEIYDFARNQM